MRSEYTRQQQSVINLSATLRTNMVAQTEIDAIIEKKPLRLMNDEEAHATAVRLREHLELCQGKRRKSEDTHQ